MKRISTQEEFDLAYQAGEREFEIYGFAQVTASGSAQVTASDSAQVTASDSAQVTAYDSAQVTASGSAQVRASDSAQVTASGSAQVTAYGSAQVRAYDSAQVTAYDSAQVTASKYVAVTLSGLAKAIGGRQIKLPKIKTAKQWCDFYGAKAIRGIVILFKAVDKDFYSSHAFVYTPGTIPKAPDWDGGKEECGGGLHFCATPFHALWFNKDAEKFVACPVRVKDIVVHKDAAYPSKIKAKGCCAPVWECDIDGKKLVGP
jgi:hypothetical protein